MYKLGIDLGGTNIAAGVVNEKFEIIGKGKVKTNAPRSAEEIADDMVKAAKEALADAGLTLADIDSCGVGSPGSIDSDAGVVTYANNLKFENVPLAKLLSDRLGMKIYLENDANAAAFGEFMAGAGKGTKDFIAITLGTGVGGGIVIDKKLYSGFNHAGGELGHIVMNFDGEMCSCGRRGCFEAYASATALIRQTKAAMEENKDSIMWKICDGDLKNVNGLTAFDAMRADDKAGKAVVDEYIRYLSIGITNIVNIFQPEKLCIGGGVSKEGDTLIKPVREFLENADYARNMKNRTTVVTAQLGNDAGIIGAAFLYLLH